jgi:hypothetical protein
VKFKEKRGRLKKKNPCAKNPKHRIKNLQAVV